MRMGAKYPRHSAGRRDLWPELNRWSDAVVGYRPSNQIRRTRAMLLYQHRSARWPMRDRTPILLQHSAESRRTYRQYLSAYERCAGRARSRAQGFAWTLPSAPDVSGCNPSPRIPGDRWAGSGGQLRVQPKRCHNPDIPNKGFAHARGAFHQHQDGGEKRLESLLPLRPAARLYDQRQRNKARHERKRAGNTLGKTMDHAQQPG